MWDQVFLERGGVDVGQEVRIGKSKENGLRVSVAEAS